MVAVSKNKIQINFRIAARQNPVSECFGWEIFHMFLLISFLVPDV